MVQVGMLVEVRLIPVEIAKAYAEILQLRIAIQEAELALRMRARSRRQRTRRDVRSLPPIDPQPNLLERGQNQLT
jgi:hypothetical protein